MTRPLIIDTFMINAEFDMLECRLEEMSPAVDYFIAVEADVDHQDHPKPYHITENLDRFDAWSEQLIVVQASGLPTFRDDPDPWARELSQREHVLQGLREVDRRVGLTEDAIILHGDVDEICRALHVRNVRPADGGEFVTFEQRMHCFAVDWQHPDPWGGTVAGRLSAYMAMGACPFQRVRNLRNNYRFPGSDPSAQPHLWHRWNQMLPDSGWHLSWLGGQRAALDKLGSFCHPEIAERTLVGLTNDLYLREGMHVDGRRMRPVDVDETWPKFIQDRRCPVEWFRPR